MQARMLKRNKYLTTFSHHMSNKVDFNMNKKLTIVLPISCAYCVVSEKCLSCVFQTYGLKLSKRRFIIFFKQNYFVSMNLISLYQLVKKTQKIYILDSDLIGRIILILIYDKDPWSVGGISCVLIKFAMPSLSLICNFRLQNNHLNLWVCVVNSKMLLYSRKNCY